MAFRSGTIYCARGSSSSARSCECAIQRSANDIWNRKRESPSDECLARHVYRNAAAARRRRRGGPHLPKARAFDRAWISGSRRRDRPDPAHAVGCGEYLQRGGARRRLPALHHRTGTETLAALGSESRHLRARHGAGGPERAAAVCPADRGRAHGLARRTGHRLRPCALVHGLCHAIAGRPVRPQHALRPARLLDPAAAGSGNRSAAGDGQPAWRLRRIGKRRTDLARNLNRDRDGRGADRCRPLPADAAFPDHRAHGRA